MLLHRFPEVSQTFVLDQISALEEAGFEVRVFATHLAKDGLLHAKGRKAAKHAAIVDRHLLSRLSSLPFIPKRTRDRIRSGVGNRLIRSAASQFDLLLCHFGPNGLRAAITTMEMERSAPIWTIFHGFDVSYYLKSKGPRVYDPLFRIGERFLPISNLWAKKLTSLGCPAERIRLLRMGVDCEAIRFNFTELSADAPVRILSVGRLTEKKGTEFSLRALSELRQTEPSLNWSFEVVGNGPLGPDLRKLAVDLRIDDRVRFLGAQSSSDVKQLLARANVFLLPSVVSADGDMEGIPVALMEAMAAGVPAVSTFHSGIPELIDSGHSGLLARERHVGELAAQLRVLIGDADLRRAIAEAARIKVETEFNQRRINADFAASIRAALLEGDASRLQRPHSPA